MCEKFAAVFGSNVHGNTAELEQEIRPILALIFGTVVHYTKRKIKEKIINKSEIMLQNGFKPILFCEYLLSQICIICLR